MGQAEVATARWTPFLKASAALHVAGAAALLAAPSTLPWVIGALIANHAGIAAAGLWPRSTLLGPNITCLPAASARRNEIALTFDDGPDPEVTPQVLDLLDAHGMRATFFCIGTRAARHPDLVRDIVRRGHELGNHSQHHSARFSLYGARRFERELAEAQHLLHTLIGHAPRWFRAPAGLRNPLLGPALAACDLRLVSWTRRGYDGVSGDANAVLRRLTHRLRGGDILVLHDGHPPRTPDGVPVVLAVLPQLLQRLRDAQLHSVSLSDALD